MTLRVSAPEPLSSAHRVDEFDCGEASLNLWLIRRALANQATGASRTFVVVDQNNAVCGYYALAAGAVAHATATAPVRRNMPDPIPVMVLARLAVAERAQGIKLGAALLQDAVNRAVTVSQNTGVRALLVHALNERAKQFYEHYGFQVSPIDAMTLMLRIKTLACEPEGRRLSVGRITALRSRNRWCSSCNRTNFGTLLLCLRRFQSSAPPFSWGQLLGQSLFVNG